MVVNYRIDIFSIVVLIILIALIVYLIILSIYFWNISNFKFPTKSESLFLFWTTIVVIIIIVLIAGYALINIFTSRNVCGDNIYEINMPSSISSGDKCAKPKEIKKKSVINISKSFSD